MIEFAGIGRSEDRASIEIARSPGRVRQSPVIHSPALKPVDDGVAAASTVDDIRIMRGYMYILRCGDGSYYVGSTRNIDHRFAQHQSGRGAEYIKRRRPVELVFCEEFDSIEDAYGMEKRVQNWSRAKREALIAGDFDALRSAARKRFGSGSD